MIFWSTISYPTTPSHSLLKHYVFGHSSLARSLGLLCVTQAGGGTTNTRKCTGKKDSPLTNLIRAPVILAFRCTISFYSSVPEGTRNINGVQQFPFQSMRTAPSLSELWDNSQKSGAAIEQVTYMVATHTQRGDVCPPFEVSLDHVLWLYYRKKTLVLRTSTIVKNERDSCLCGIAHSRLPSHH